MVKSSDRDQGVTPLSKSLAPLARLERAAHGLGIRCSIHLSYRGNGLNIGLIILLVKMEG